MTVLQCISIVFKCCLHPDPHIVTTDSHKRVGDGYIIVPHNMKGSPSRPKKYCAWTQWFWPSLDEYSYSQVALVILL